MISLIAYLSIVDENHLLFKVFSGKINIVKVWSNRNVNCYLDVVIVLDLYSKMLIKVIILFLVANVIATDAIILLFEISKGIQKLVKK